jgi:spore germination cell wall hydrolase CwlJ-like protein
MPAIRVPNIRFPRLEREHWLSSTVLAVAVALYLFAGISVTSLASPDGTANAKAAISLKQQLAGQALPAAEPLKFKPVAPQDAVAINAAVPIAAVPNPAARAFLLNAGPDVYSKSLSCLTAAIYYEAATESLDGQRAVAQVVLNRLRHPAYPNSVCGVVFQGSERSTGCQFTFTCDGALARTPNAAIWERSRSVAAAALAGSVYAPVGWATHYHTNWVVPYWSSSLVKVANVGTHIFYRWEGGWGRAPAFRDSHSGTEPVVPKMGYLGFGSIPKEEAKTELTPEDKAALAAAELPAAQLAEGAPMPAAVAATSYDPGALNRAIVRRFEPVKREDVAATLAKQTAAGAKVDESHRWALTGEGVNSGQALGKKAAAPAPAAEAKPAS